MLVPRPRRRIGRPRPQRPATRRAPPRPRYPFTVMVGRTPTHFNDRDAADRCAAQYGTTVTAN
ncbi:hypothetical protein ACWEPA_25230 [Streptomyces filamentosus]